MSDANPVLVEVTRGDLVESHHRGAIAVADARGRVVRAWGDVAQPVFPRSANKPLQALALLETGAAARFGLDDAEVALACASHYGEPRHTQAVAAWLDRVGLGPEALECGAHAPYDAETAATLLRTGTSPSALHNNCSGKHAGFLTTAVHRGETPRFYVGYEHPVQRRVSSTIAALCGEDAARLPWGVDGCGIPTLALPLRALATGMARLADPAGLPAERRDAARRITAAMAAHPLMIGGRDSFASIATMALGDGIVVKTGAEAVFTAVLPGRGWGVAIKIDDGGARAAERALIGALAALGAVDPARAEALDARCGWLLRNRAGRAVGAIRPAEALDPPRA